MEKITDHRDLIASLSDEQRHALTLKSDRKGLLALAVHLGAIVVTGTLIWWRVPFWPLIMIAHGLLITFLFSLLHEAIHRTPFRSVWLNDVVAHICGFILVIPALWFRYFHLAHHRHTQDPDNDPELFSPKPETIRQYVLHVTGLLFWWRMFKTILNQAADRGDEAYIPRSARSRVRVEARLYVAAYVAFGLGCWWLGTFEPIYLWIIPALLGQPFLRLFLLAEHGRCPLVANMLENTRTTFTNGIVRRLSWNMSFHAEHHSFPTVPFHQLPNLHSIAKDHLGETENGYVAFNRNYVSALKGAGEN